MGWAQVGCAVLGLMLVGWLGLPQPAWGAIAQPTRIPLTLELLQQRLKAPIPIEGIPTLDLRSLVIDLRPENEAFRRQFYQALNQRLQQSASPLGIDLSFSSVQGEFDVSALGLRVPLYGEALSPNFTEAEQLQLRRDRRRLTQLSQLSRSLLIEAQPPSLQITVLRGPLRLSQTQFDGLANFTNTFFLNRVEAQGTDFRQTVDWSDARFSQPVSFGGSLFRHDVRFRNVIFFSRAGFNQVRFQNSVLFQGSEFQDTANFSRAVFEQPANFTRVQWRGNADFAQTDWQRTASFNQSQFSQALFLAEATFQEPVTFREVQFNQPVNLRNASIDRQIDLGDAVFAAGAYLNVAGLQFNPDQAKIVGDPGQIGQYLSVPSLQGNETLLRNLVRNFRMLEQIPDANRIDYLMQKLRLQLLKRHLLGTNLNTASLRQLRAVGFSEGQAAAIARTRDEQVFRSSSDVLKVEGVDLATYVRLRDRIVAAPARSLGSWGMDALKWLSLSVVLLLTRFGTSSWLTFGVGMVAIAYFSLVFWAVDRVRRLHPRPILPTLAESLWMVGTAGLLSLLGISSIFRLAEYPWWTLAALGVITVPVPAVLLVLLYKRGRYHNLMDVSYLVEDGSMRQFRILIGRLPNIPKFPLFRDRYTPIPWDRRWNWLNYIDFSLNNLLKFGFNDIRLRDEELPGLITALAWYQWSLGMLYIALFLWTLSRTIPGLNLLIYFK